MDNISEIFVEVGLDQFLNSTKIKLKNLTKFN